MTDILDMKLSEVGFSNRLYNALTRHEDTFYFTAPRTLRDLVSLTPKAILRFGIGKVMLKQLDDKLASMGLSLAPDARPLKQYRVEETPEQKEEKEKKVREENFRKLHTGLLKLVEKNRPDDCFVSIISVVGQLLIANFEEEEYPMVLAKMSVDIIKVTELLHSIVDEMQDGAPSSAVH